MELSHFIHKLEKYSEKALEFSLREYDQLQSLRADVLKIEKFSLQAIDADSPIKEYQKHTLKLERLSERIEKKLNAYTKRLEKQVYRIGRRLNLEDKAYFQSFLDQLRVCKNKLIIILAKGGELHQLIKMNPPKWNKIREKIDEALGTETTPGIMTMILSLKQLQSVEKRLKNADLEKGLKSYRERANRILAESDSTPFDSEAIGASERLRKIKMEREEQALIPVKEIIRKICFLFSQKLGLPITERDLPNVRVNPALNSPAVYYPEGQFIELKSIQSFNGDSLAEEIAHFFRDKFHHEKTEERTHEFFGYLGRRLLYEILPVAEKRALFLTPPVYAITKEVMLEEMRQAKEKTSESIEIRIKKSKAYRDGDEKEVERLRRILPKLANSEYSDALSHLTHFLGYYYAARVDLSKIKDFRKLFTMPDSEVRRRFFREDQDYSRQ